ncbi:MAG: PQQ-binding-like beta-propeller repeat protein [Planctomycetota bacterium]|nr:PQQ-binding-like beta-propeller repeat protein [Planctomycetota bacterium]
MRTRLTALAVTALVAVAWAATWGCPYASAAEKPKAADVLAKIGVTRGICVLPGDKDCELALELARNSELTLFVQVASYDEMQAACKAADAAGMNGSRIFVATGGPARIGLADNVADAVFAASAPDTPQAEVLRVLRPAGKAVLGPEVLTKPFPEGVDDWTHHYHGPDNNPQSLDRLARAPFLTQFIAEPRYAPAPQCAVAAAGRIFMAFGHVAWHQREEAMLDTLIALNGFNGTLLWKRPLPSGNMVDRSTMIATPAALYLAEGKSCKVLDAATGQQKDEIAAPADLPGGTFWKWMALDGGVLYALVGEDEEPDPVAAWKMTGHGWPWDRISKGYNTPPRLWGQGKTLLAIDAQTKKVLWQRAEEQPVDSRALCMKNGRMYICCYGKCLACLDAKTGKDIWRRTAEKDAEVFQAIGPYRQGQGYVEGWKTAVYLKCTDKALYFVGPQVPWLTALSADDGHVLWKYPGKDLHVVIRDDGLYVIGPQNRANDSKKLDALTGNVLASYDVKRRACTRATGNADGIFFRGHEGSGRLDTASGKTQWISAVRPSCHVGVVIANGQCYWLPWACDCDLQMFGAMALGPAGPFDFAQKATDEGRLERVVTTTTASAKFDASPADWPAYRGNNTRTAQTQAAVPETAKALWQLEGTLPGPTAPVTAGGLVFVGAADGALRALDAATSKARWTAFTGGRIHYPPALAAGRAFVGSGDGWAYCFEAATGKPLWRFRAAPVERRVPMFGALSSTWPVAGGVLVEGDTAYFAAGINDLDGTHVYALEAATGKLKWENNTCGQLDEFSRRGVACQGELLFHEGKLYLAGGNSVSPGVFDAATGKCLNSPPGGMGTSAPRGRELVLVNNQVKVCGQPLHSRPDYPVFDKSCDWANPVVAAPNGRLTLASRKGDQGVTWVLAAQKPDGSELWSQPLPAEPIRWGIAMDAGGRIVVTLQNGQVLCFGK